MTTSDQSLQFDQLDIGDEIGPLRRVPTTEAVRQFCLAWHNEERETRFTSDEIGQNTGTPRALVPGILSIGYLHSLLASWAPSGRVKRIDAVFRQPILHNTPIQLHGVIVGKETVADEKQVTFDLRVEGEDNTFITAVALMVFK